MKKLFAYILLIITCVAIFSSCGSTVPLENGTYRVEYDSYDDFGYKDFIEIKVVDGAIVSIVADGVDQNGSLKTESGDYKTSMESITGTYPAKYYKDLINEYTGKGSIDNVDVIAGATISSESFKVLMKAVEKTMKSQSSVQGNVLVVKRG